MSDAPSEIPATPPVPAGRPVPCGYPVAAWLVIGIVVGFILLRHATARSPEREGFDPAMMELQGRYIVGLADFLGQRNEAVLRQANVLDQDGNQERLRFSVLAGELAGPKAAREQLHDITDGTGSESETARALDDIYRAREAEPPLAPPPEAVERVRQDLGWFGDLAAAPPDDSDPTERAAVLRPARRTAVVLMSGGAVALAGAALGFFLLVAGLALAANGAFRPRLATGSPFGGVYAETFAAWMLLFLGMSYAASFVPAGASKLGVTGLFMLASLAALGWPVVRGVPWHVVRYDAGLAKVQRPGAEVLAGCAAYAAALPLLAAGVIVTLVFMAMARRLGAPQQILEHPLGPLVLRSGVWVRVQAYLVAGIVAPVVEETMFRGVLYRHLREAAAAGGRVASVLTSGLVASFVFAVIHPQGWFGVPPLMGLAFGFCLAREWRGTLLPGMVAHAIQNTAVTTMLILAAG
jgi:membrane protease YdiL (CAAX protease family)